MKVSNLDITSMVLIMVACILVGNYIYDRIEQLYKTKQIEDNLYYVNDMVIIKERFDGSDELINKPLVISRIHEPYIFFDVLYSDEKGIKVRIEDVILSHIDKDLIDRYKLKQSGLATITGNGSITMENVTIDRNGIKDTFNFTVEGE